MNILFSAVDPSQAILECITSSLDLLLYVLSHRSCLPTQEITVVQDYYMKEEEPACICIYKHIKYISIHVYTHILSRKI